MLQSLKTNLPEDIWSLKDEWSEKGKNKYIYIYIIFHKEENVIYTGQVFKYFWPR
jgi:hypothetical protein